MMVVEDEEQFVYFWIWIKCLIAFAIEKEYWVSWTSMCLLVFSLMKTAFLMQHGKSTII